MLLHRADFPVTAHRSKKYSYIYTHAVPKQNNRTKSLLPATIFGCFWELLELCICCFERLWQSVDGCPGP